MGQIPSFEGEQVAGARVRFSGSQEISRSLKRGSSVVVVAVAHVTGVDHVPFEKALARVHHTTLAEVFITDEKSVADILGKLRDEVRAATEERTGQSPLPLEGDELKAKRRTAADAVRKAAKDGEAE